MSFLDKKLYQPSLRLLVSLRDDADQYVEDFGEGVISASNVWHTKIEDLHAAGKISHRQMEALHKCVQFTASDLATTAVPNSRDESGERCGWEELHRSMKTKLVSGIDQLVVDYETSVQPAVPFSQSVHWQKIPASKLFVADAVSVDEVIMTKFSPTDVCMAFGPYIQLPAAKYIAKFYFEYSARGTTSTCFVGVDVASSGDPIARRQINIQSLLGSKPEIVLPFVNSIPESYLEFRIFINGRPHEGELSFIGIGVDKDEATSELEP